MEAKQGLAEQIVARYHGDEAGREARGGFQQKFQAREFPDEPDVRVKLSAQDLKGGESIGMVELVAKTGLVPSKSEARRLIVQGGVEFDQKKQIDGNAIVKLEVGRQYQMKVGRRKFALIERI